MTANNYCLCQSTSRFKINMQSDWIRMARCNIWTPIKNSQCSFLLLRNSPTIHVRRTRLISGCHLFAMSFLFQATESGQDPVRLDLRHGQEWNKEGTAWVGIISRLHLFLLNTGRRASYLQYIYYRVVVVFCTMLEMLQNKNTKVTHRNMQFQCPNKNWQ